MKRTIKLHVEDKKVVISFIDYARLEKKENVTLEILARHMAEKLKVNPDQSNKRLANKFATLLETGAVK